MYCDAKAASYEDSSIFILKCAQTMCLVCDLFLSQFHMRREEAAISELYKVAQDTRVGERSEGAHLHIVHLSDAGKSLDIIKVFELFFFDSYVQARISYDKN